LRSERIGITSLTYQGHVTSSVMWFPVGNLLLVSFGTN